MIYAGEHLFPGQLGHFCTVFSFVASLLAFTGYWLSTHHRTNEPTANQWRSVGRLGWALHGLTTLGIVGALFYILVNKYYEYQYAWSNISDDLPVQYVFSAFWKEQQGSFLLWSFWHLVLGAVLIARAGRWESPVMTFLAGAEAVIGSMILGLYVGDTRIGASAFDLMRHTMDAPIFTQADYLTKIKGRGLTPLLQNYWMTIHPPTLFLGFASTVVPFAYAAAGLWLREHRAWLRPALQWSLFSAAVLGTGILMGGAWAYEALSFGGYWAWDPVENASLVPWITLVAGVHANLIARNTGYSIRSAYLFYLLTFLLILYSTYLTRSGILGDSSAHSFTEMGLGAQLILFMAVFKLAALWLFLSRMRGVPDMEREESAKSREFWMFMGALVLMFSAVLITGATSLPLWNKIVQLFNPSYIGAALKDPANHHNRYQLWIAVFIATLSGVGQWLRYQERNWAIWGKKVGLHMAIAAIGALLLTFLNKQWIQVNAWQLHALLFAAMFTVVSNADYLITFAKGNLKVAASAVSHVGFGVLVLGILSTGLGKEWISANSFAMEGLIEGMEGEALNQNVLLMKEAPLPVRRQIQLTYLSDTIERQTRTFTVKVQRLDTLGDPTGEPFYVYPNVMYDRQFAKIEAANPSTKHYWNYDVFTHVSSLPRAELEPEYAKQQEDSLQYTLYEAKVGDTVRTSKGNILILEGFTKRPQHPDYHPEPGDLAFGVSVRAFGKDNVKPYTGAPLLCIRPGKGGFAIPATMGPLQMKVRLSDKAIQWLFEAEQNLQFTRFPLKEGQTFTYKGYTVHFQAVDRTVNHPSYAPQPDDIAVSARLNILGPDGRTYTAAPVYLIRDNQPYSLKDEVPSQGLHFQFEHIDPKTGILTLGAAQTDASRRLIPLEIAEEIPRSDYIVLEAIVFPGINLVWAGSILMLMGLALGLWRRMRERVVGH